MNARIVLFLGRQREAKQTRYVRVGEGVPLSRKKTYLPWSVLMEDVAKTCSDSVTQVVVIGSNETYGDWKCRIDDDACDAGPGYTDRQQLPIGFLRYQDDTFTPSNPAVYWGFFDNLRRALGGEPVAGLDGFCVVGDSPVEAFAEPAHYVLMDITRGFRAAPFIGASALAFVRAADRRRQDRPSVRHRIFYAAYEAESDDDITPVWDLTPFVDGVELSDALDAFTRHGRADDLAHFFQDSQNPAAKAVAEPMQQFADDLLLMRCANLLTHSAPALHKALSDSLEPLKNALPPVAEELDSLKKQINELVPNGIKVDPISLKGLEAARILAQRLWDTGRFPDLWNLLRESLLTAFSLVAVQGPLYQPDQKEFREQRKQVEDSWYPLLPWANPEKQEPMKKIQTQPERLEEALKIAKLISKVGNLRNDVAHCSMRGDPKGEKWLRDALSRTLEDFKELVASITGPHRTV